MCLRLSLYLRELNKLPISHFTTVPKSLSKFVSARFESRSLQIGMLVSIPLIAWAGLIAKLTTDWSTNPQYEFGYFVPFFILYLLARRWNSRPSAAVSRPFISALWLGSAIMFLLLPLKIVQEANPDWRPFNWFLAMVVVTLSAVPFAMVGGVGWVTHFIFPFLLIFAALPWPLATEQTVLQGLSAAVTFVTVELLNLINIPALQRGNAIDIATGSIGIADACSGIRSLAGTLMASLFFGEFYRLGVLKRIILVAGGCLMAFGLNLVRAFFLSWRAAAEGIYSIEKWHDPAGFSIFAVSFASLWLFAIFMVKSESEDVPSGAAEVELPSFQMRYLLCGLFWMLSIHVISELWYKNQESKRSAPTEWDLLWPEPGKSFRFGEIPRETRSILRFTSGKSAKFDWSDGSIWQVFFFHWAPGRSSAQLATMHRPEVCLPAVGYKYIRPVELINISTSDIAIPFSGSLFECDGKGVFVYRCLWEDFQIDKLTRNTDFDLSIQGRLYAAWYGRRNLGQRMLQIAIIGLNSEEEARDQLRLKLTSLIVLKS